MAERKDFAAIRERRDQYEHLLRRRGLVPVGRIHYAWQKTTDPEPFPSTFPHTAGALQTLDLPYEVHNTRKPHLGAAIQYQKEIWVTREVHGLLFAVSAASAYFGYVGFPEMARRFALQPEALTALDVAFRLGLSIHSNGIRPLMELVRKPVRSLSLIAALREIRTAG